MSAKQIQINRSARELEVIYRWRSGMTYFLLFFALFWNGLITVFLVVGAGLFIVLHALVGIGIAWVAITQLLNRSVLRINSREVSVTHGPLPSWRRSRTVPAREINQLFIRKGGTYSSGTKKTQLWNLVLETSGAKTYNLLSGLTDKIALEGIEEEAENLLRIEDEQRSENAFDLDGLRQFREKLPPILAQKVDRYEERMEERTGQSLEEMLRTEFPTTGEKPNRLPPPTSDIDYPFYRALDGERFRLENQLFQVYRSAQIDFENPHYPIARQLEVRLLENPEASPANSATRYFYAEHLRSHWSYYEERRLDEEELSTLGFIGDQHPPSFANGDDRYYPRELQKGKRFFGEQVQAVEQYIYFTTRDTAQFRALRALGGRWEVYVQEPIDDSAFINA